MEHVEDEDTCCVSRSMSTDESVFSRRSGTQLASFRLKDSYAEPVKKKD